MGQMELETVQNLIISKFDAFWLTTPIEHVNSAIDKTKIDEWVRLSISHMPAKPFTFAMGSVRGGFVNIQIFTKMNIGQGRAIDLATKAGKFIQALSTGSLVMRPYDLTIVGNKASNTLTTTEISWFQVNCIIEFTYID